MISEYIVSGERSCNIAEQSLTVEQNQLQITEIHPRPTQLGPEWIEIYNPNDFAVSLYGWSLTQTSGSSVSNLLLKEGIITGKATAIFTGDASSQVTGNASEVIDLGLEGFLPFFICY